VGRAAILLAAGAHRPECLRDFHHRADSPESHVHPRSQHSHLDLQVNLLAEEKNSKIIRMLEELRRDLPNVRDKSDPEAEELSRPTDTEAVLSIIEESSEQLNCERK
jgi:hypothetical protein